jgi:hypothetical protein
VQVWSTLWTRAPSGLTSTCRRPSRSMASTRWWLWQQASTHAPTGGAPVLVVHMKMQQHSTRKPRIDTLHLHASLRVHARLLNMCVKEFRPACAVVRCVGSRLRQLLLQVRSHASCDLAAQLDGASVVYGQCMLLWLEWPQQAVTRAPNGGRVVITRVDCHRACSAWSG